uniref:Uncharacterized protein n=1 Tax=Siphoviridae sp. ctaDn21 TaxID=2825563 RepID=A0A8S5UUX2_9CAUD|nr:MAG TPA: hypothetical protein [Siphoviridae sp. ctaDn21]
MFKFNMVDNDEMVINVMVEFSPSSITQITFFKGTHDLTQFAKLFFENGKSRTISWGSSTSLLSTEIKATLVNAKEYLIEQGVVKWHDKGYSSLIDFIG